MKSPGRVFNFIWRGVLWLLVGIVVLGGISNLSTAGPTNGLLSLLRLAAGWAVVSFILYGTPLLIVLLGLSVWGLFKYPMRRRKFGVIVALLVVWLPLAIWASFDIPWTEL